MKLIVPKSTVSLNNDRSQDRLQRSGERCHVACKLGLIMLLAAGCAVPGRADEVKATRGDITIQSDAPAVTASDFRVDSTLLPSGVVRHTVSRATAVKTDLDVPTVALNNGAYQSPFQPTVLAMGRQATPAGRLLPLSLRLGLSVSPRIKFVGGVDYTLAGLGTTTGLSTRVDFDAVVSANFGGLSTLFPLTIDEIFRIPLSGGTNIYAGAGIGPMLGERTRFGGKFLVGGHLSDRLSIEGTVLFAGYGDPLLNVQIRFPIL